MHVLWKVLRCVRSGGQFSSFPLSVHGVYLRAFLTGQHESSVVQLMHFSNVHSKSRNRRILEVDNLFKRQKCQKYTPSEEQRRRNRTVMYYTSAFTALVGGFTYLSVLLYRIYCQSTGKGGQAVKDEDGERIINMKPVENRMITVNFSADTNAAMLWNFRPQQPHIKVSPGETALAFYTAKNPSDKPVTGIATYNILPFEAGKYFNKIQCFCFEEQRLNPNEEVDMPVFFYLDPEYANDPWLENINDIILSYTFFEAKEGFQVPQPKFLNQVKSVQ